MEHLVTERSNILNSISLNNIQKAPSKLLSQNKGRNMLVSNFNKENENAEERFVISKFEKSPPAIEKCKSKESLLSGQEKEKAFRSTQVTNKGSKRKLIALFIGGLGPSVTEQDLKEVFGTFPSLTSVKICYDSKTKASLRYGYLNFKNNSDVEECIEKYNYNELFGNEIKIMPSLRNSLYRKNIGTNVFFSNLPLENPDLTTRIFYDTFKSYGKILSCKLDNRKNIGFVYFEDDKAATKVIEDYNNKEYFGTKIVCGLHFDKELRNFPDFDKRKLNLDKSIILDDELNVIDNVDSNTNANANMNTEKPLVHPNAIFVKNLPKDTTEEELLEYFSKIGPIKSVYTSEGSAKYTTKWAFVTYKKLSDTEKSIEQLNNNEFKSSKITVSKAKPRKNVKDNFKEKPFLLLSNMSTICTKEFLSKLCSQEKLYFEQFKITGYNTTKGTFSGVISMKSKLDQLNICDYLDGKLVGGSILHARVPRSDSELNFSPLEFSSNNDEVLIDQRDIKIMPNVATNHLETYRWNQMSYFPNYMFLQQKRAHDEKLFKKQLFHVTDVLKKQIKKSMDFLRIHKDTSDQTLRCVAEYIIKVYWCNNINALSKFLLLLNSNIQYEEVLHKQIVDSLKHLGFTKEPDYPI